MTFRHFKIKFLPHQLDQIAVLNYLKKYPKRGNHAMHQTTYITIRPIYGPDAQQCRFGLFSHFWFFGCRKFNAASIQGQCKVETALKHDEKEKAPGYPCIQFHGVVFIILVMK